MEVAREMEVVNEMQAPVVQSSFQNTVTQKTTVRVVETVTETATLKIETVTETETMRVKATVTMTEASEATGTSTNWNMDIELYGAPASDANAIMDDSMLIEAH